MGCTFWECTLQKHILQDWTLLEGTLLEATLLEDTLLDMTQAMVSRSWPGHGVATIQPWSRPCTRPWPGYCTSWRRRVGPCGGR